jgi:hypothetical protein
MDRPAVSRLRRIAGIVLMAGGAVLFLASSCPYLMAIGDYFDLIAPWSGTCPDSFHIKALLIGAVVIAVAGQRLFSGRDLRTGEKPKPAED